MFQYGDTRIRSSYWAKVKPLDNGCWEWTGHQKRFGYGQIKAKRITGQKNTVAHRVFYLVLVGPIPEGMQLDHLCRNRACVNPAHLEVVTPRENTLRGTSITAVNAQKTHCNRGHEFTPENTRVIKNGWRVCRQCRRDADHARKSDPAYRRYWNDMRNASRDKLMADPEYRARINEQQCEGRQRRGPYVLTPEQREQRRAYRVANSEHLNAVRRAWRQRRKEAGLPHM